MASTQVDKVLSVYKLLCQIPGLASARILGAAERTRAATGGNVAVQSVWSQRNLEKRSRQKFVREFHLTQDLRNVFDTFPIDNTTEMLTAYSEDESLKAILRDVTVDGKSKQFIEIWNRKNFSKSYDLSAFDLHGDVYADMTFSAFQWSPDNTKLLYVAEKKLPKSEPFYKQSKKQPAPGKSEAEKDEKIEKKADNAEEEPPTKGTEYIYKPDWGEQLVGKHRSVVVVLNVSEDTIQPLKSIPNDYFPAQVLWCPDGSGDIVGVAYKLSTRYLGLYACTNREACIFHLKDQKEFRILSATDTFCTAPRFSPDGKHLIWLERDVGPAHHNVQRLMRLGWGVDDKPSILVNTVRKRAEIGGGKHFYGLYNHSLPKRCWSEDSRYVFLSTPQRYNVKSYVVSLGTSLMFEIDSSGGDGRSSLLVEDVRADYVVCSEVAMNRPARLLIGKFDPSPVAISDFGRIDFRDCAAADDDATSELPYAADELVYDHTEYVYDDREHVNAFNFTYFGKKSDSQRSMPLVAVGHGGPHASYCNMFYPFYVLLSQLNFGVLLINYRGSTGMGGDNVEYLLGKVGETDVEDCMTAIDAAVQKYPWIDPDRINVYGGSHGGFLGAHLSGQYPDYFRSVLLLNPVIDIAAMHASSDIPDWCRAESGCSSILKSMPDSSDEKLDYTELLIKMLKHSPILHADKVKAPTLLALGTKDLRVPCSQGKLWYNKLTENGVVTKLFMYEDNHSLMKDEVELDNVINMALWLLEHNEK